jgi:hypothetical protein
VESDTRREARINLLGTGEGYANSILLSRISRVKKVTLVTLNSSEQTTPQDDHLRHHPKIDMQKTMVFSVIPV